MIKVVVSGAKGKMSKAVTELIRYQEDMKVIAGFDTVYEEEGITIYDDL